MKLLGNIIWIVFGGVVMAAEYMISGLILCMTIIGIPFGLQIFKLGLLSLFPFGQKVVTKENSVGMGCLNLIMNLIWLIFGGVIIMLSHLALGIIFCLTIVGIPFGLQHFKLMLIALTPFGRDVVAE